MSIFWLTSYPKSGNTWMRILLTNYIRNTSTPANINRLENISIASSRGLFDEWVGVEASTLDNNTIERLRPGVYRCMTRETCENIYIKTHESWHLTDCGEGLFPSSVTGGAIYILRNPLDMASSCANHWGVSIEQAVNNLCDPLFVQASTIEEMPDQLSQKIGSWSDHVSSWLDHSGLNVHLVRFEDLHRDPIAVFGKVIEFCHMPLDKERLVRAVNFSKFSELQNQESVNDFRERSPKACKPFFRRGQVGSWREELPVHLVQRLIDVHGKIMLRFKYLDENYQPY